MRVVTNNDKRKEVSAELIFLKIDGCFTQYNSLLNMLIK